MKRPTDTERILELCLWMSTDYHRQLRERSPLSQQDIAHECEVTQSAVARWESNERRPRGRAAVAYHKVLSRLADAEAARAAKDADAQAETPAHAPPPKVTRTSTRLRTEVARC